METNRKVHTRWQKFGRWGKLNYLKLFRAKGGASMVAKGFSIGLAVEMFTLPTVGLAALLILPLAYFFRASVTGALIGFLFGKIIYLPMLFLISRVGKWIAPNSLFDYIHFLPGWLERFCKGAMDLIVGGMIVGAVLGIVAYFPIRYLLELYTGKRKEKRRRRKAQLLGNDNS